jgi:hypothetical protein
MMPLPIKHGRYALFTGWLLLVAALFGAVTDSRASVMFRHSHEEGHHLHEHDSQDPKDMHSSPCETPDDPNAPHSGDDSHGHQMDPPHIPFCSLCFHSVGLMPPVSDRAGLLSTSPERIDGPYFELIKPPQIG